MNRSWPFYIFCCRIGGAPVWWLLVTAGVISGEMGFTDIRGPCPCPSFLSIRLGSFGSFLRLSAPPRRHGGSNLCGIFSRGFPVASAHGGFILRFLSCCVSPPHCAVSRYLRHNLACDMPLGTGVGLCYASPSRRSFNAFVRSMFLNAVPCVASGNAFIVGNTRHIIISRLRHSPNIFFNRNIRTGNAILCSTHVVPFGND